ncbi:MAG TPA: zinc-binding dehydrogenase [bacterium]|nr:zinc-binding dehydrogenase [bacterium]
MGVEPAIAILPSVTRAVVFHSPGDLRLEHVPLPAPGSGDLVVRIRACGLCPGEAMDWYMARKAPLALGHEPVAEIIHAGAGVRGFAVGERVFVHHHAPCLRCARCRRGDFVHCATWRRSRLHPGGVSEFAVVPSEIVRGDTLRLPAQLADEAATFVEPLACVVKSLRRGGLRQGGSVLVIGLGVMGLLHVLLARRLGAGMIIGADRIASRLAHAQSAGADVVVDVADNSLPDAVRRATGEDGADLVVVGPGTMEAIESGFASAAPGGTVVLFTPTPPEARFPLPVHDAYFREIRIVPSYSAGPDDTAEALRHLLDGVPVESLITHRLSLDAAPEGYRLVREAKDALKVVVRP